MINPGNKVFFSGNGDVITVASVVGRLSVVYSIGATTLLSEAYDADSSGNVVLRDIGKIAASWNINPSAESALSVEGIAAVVSVSIEDSVDSFDFTVTVWPCDRECGSSLTESLYKEMGLCLCTERNTYPGASEELSFWVGTSGRTIKLGIGYLAAGVTHYCRTTVALAAGSSVLSYKALDVSPSVMIAKVLAVDAVTIVPRDILFYDVYDTTEVRYNMVKFPVNAIKTFRFLNSFHAIETLSLVGDIETELKATRVEATVYRRNKLSELTPLRSITQYTGYLTDEIYKAVEDLICSKDVALVTSAGLVPVVIESETLKVSDRSDETKSGSFVYHPASVNAMSFQRTSRTDGTGIFDNTFDQTFD